MLKVPQVADRNVLKEMSFCDVQNKSSVFTTYYLPLVLVIIKMYSKVAELLEHH